MDIIYYILFICNSYYNKWAHLTTNKKNEKLYNIHIYCLSIYCVEVYAQKQLYIIHAYTRTFIINIIYYLYVLLFFRFNVSACLSICILVFLSVLSIKFEKYEKLKNNKY